MKKRMKKTLSFEVGISEHCNLNCKGCSHFSPISPKYNMPLDLYAKDLRQLSNIFHGKAGRIHIMGGEPLLHPQLNEILIETRKCFPKAKIRLVTNGKNYKSLTADFWKLCRNNNIILSPTKYPYDINYDEFKRMAKSNHVKYRYMNGLKKIKKLKKFPFDLSGSQCAGESFRLCTQANKCITLKHGKLYPCSTAAYADIFNRYFDENLVLTEDDSVNIYEVQNEKEILKRLSHPIHFCSYCGIKKIEKGLKWEESKKEKSEWV